MLTPEQLHRFNEDGFLAVEDFFSKDDSENLLQRAKKLVADFDLSSHPKTKFISSVEKHVEGTYFLESGDKIRYFFEEHALNADGELVVPKEQSINKIGHALHELDSVFREFSTRDSIKQVSRDLGFKDPRILQSMVIFKNPKIGGEVMPHIDSTFLYTEPPSAIGLWFALEDCTPQNGCMWFAPGSHKGGKVPQRFVRDGPDATKFIDLDSDATPPADDAFVCVPTRAGTLVLINGQVWHKSNHNASDRSRNIYTFHMIEGSRPYPKDNWLQTDAPFMKLLEA